MEDTLKRNIRQLGIFMLIAAVIPLFSLLFPLLPMIIRQIAALIMTICCPLFYLWVLLFGGAVIFALPCKKIFRRLIFAAWIPLYTLLCWGWTTLIFFGLINKVKTIKKGISNKNKINLKNLSIPYACPFIFVGNEAQGRIERQQPALSLVYSMIPL